MQSNLPPKIAEEYRRMAADLPNIYVCEFELVGDTNFLFVPEGYEVYISVPRKTGSWLERTEPELCGQLHEFEAGRYHVLTVRFSNDAQWHDVTGIRALDPGTAWPIRE